MAQSLPPFPGMRMALLVTEGVKERLGDAPQSLLALIMVTSNLARSKKMFRRF